MSVDDKIHRPNGCINSEGTTCFLSAVLQVLVAALDNLTWTADDNTQHVLKCLLHELETSSAAASPKDLVACLGAHPQFKHLFADKAQQCSQELLDLVLGQVCSLDATLQVTDGLCCSKCPNRRTETVVAAQTLHLAISGGSLNDCLAAAEHPEIMENCNAVWCPTCNKHVSAVKTTAFHAPGTSIVFQLKRFCMPTDGGYKKVGPQ